MAAAVIDENAQRPMSVEEELKNFRATWDAPDPTRPPDVEIVMPEADLEDWPRLDRAHCAAARDAERISGRTLIDEEEDLEDPSCVPNPYEFEDAAEAELREVFPLRTILCGARAIAVRPSGRPHHVASPTWPAQSMPLRFQRAGGRTAIARAPQSSVRSGKTSRSSASAASSNS